MNKEEIVKLFIESNTLKSVTPEVLDLAKTWLYLDFAKSVAGSLLILFLIVVFGYVIYKINI